MLEKAHLGNTRVILARDFAISDGMLLLEGFSDEHCQTGCRITLNKLPDDCSVEDIQYHLYVLDKVRRGLEDASVNGTLSQEEVESHLSKWLAE